MKMQSPQLVKARFALCCLFLGLFLAALSPAALHGLGNALAALRAQVALPLGRLGGIGTALSAARDACLLNFRQFPLSAARTCCSRAISPSISASILFMSIIVLF